MKTKICTGKCKRRLPMDAFALRNTNNGRYRSDCKDCYNELQRTKYLRDLAIRTKQKIRQRKLQERNQEYRWEYLRTHPCVDCGETDLRVLEFDHVKNKKYRSISYLVNHGFSLEVVIEEIKKCEVVCGNCHRIRTGNREGWFKCLPEFQQSLEGANAK